MKHKLYPGLFLLILLNTSCLNRSPNKDDWQSLFNGRDLTGWETYLGPEYDTMLNRRDTVPIGLNNDPSEVFSVVDLDGEKVIRISGKDFGGISTTGEFENYHLQLQFRWGELQWAPRKKAKKDSGLMYHAVGPHGADGGNWMRSHEFQIQQGDCGDYWACAGAVFDTRAGKIKDGIFVYNPDSALLTFSNVSNNGRRCIKAQDAEKPAGEWNTVDLYCFGDSSIHMMNGVLLMTLQNSRQIENGNEIPLLKGKIQIQSEGAEIFYRNIRIRPIDKLPDAS